jgi:hypothetical protein
VEGKASWTCRSSLRMRADRRRKSDRVPTGRPSGENNKEATLCKDEVSSHLGAQLAQLASNRPRVFRRERGILAKNHFGGRKKRSAH